MRLTAAALFVAVAGTAAADFEITEIWAGALPGSEATSDWFEVTNLGGSAMSLAGTYYDDDSADPTKDDEVLGIGSVAAGESVILLVSWEDDYATFAEAKAAFNTAWGALPGVQIGYVDGGSGLGGGGDAAFLFDGNTAGANTLATAAYSDDAQPESFIYNPITGVFGEFAQAGVFGAYESLVPASSSLLDPAVGSPGAIPAPASAALLGLAGLAARRRR